MVRDRRRRGYWDAESNEHGTGYDAVEVNGTSAPNPYAGKALPHYTSGKVQRVPDAEWETLLGRPIPADTVKIDRNMTLGELNHSRSPLCWLVWAVLTMLLNASYKRGKPDLNVLFQYNMPLRALAKMTSGAISMGHGGWHCDGITGILDHRPCAGDHRSREKPGTERTAGTAPAQQLRKERGYLCSYGIILRQNTPPQPSGCAKADCL